MHKYSQTNCVPGYCRLLRRSRSTSRRERCRSWRTSEPARQQGGAAARMGAAPTGRRAPWRHRPLLPPAQRALLLLLHLSLCNGQQTSAAAGVWRAGGRVTRLGTSINTGQITARFSHYRVLSKPQAWMYDDRNYIDPNQARHARARSTISQPVIVCHSDSREHCRCPQAGQQQLGIGIGIHRRWQAAAVGPPVHFQTRELSGRRSSHHNTVLQGPAGGGVPIRRAAGQGRARWQPGAAQAAEEAPLMALLQMRPRLPRPPSALVAHLPPGAS